MTIIKQNNLLWYMYIQVFVGFSIICLTTKLVAAKYIVLNNKSMQPTLAQKYAESIIECAAICSSNKDCQFASYNSVTSSCATRAHCQMEIGDYSTSVLMKMPEKVLCEPYWFSFNGKCYYFEKNELEWQDAKNDCQLKGANLVKIEDSCVQEWIMRVLTENGFRYSWIGATDMSSEGTWIWASNNTVVTYTYWDVADNEPDNKDNVEHCAIMRRSANYKWYDRDCLHTYSYICEKLL